LVALFGSLASLAGCQALLGSDKDNDSASSPTGILVRDSDKDPTHPGTEVNLTSPHGTQRDDLLLAFIDTAALDTSSVTTTPVPFAERGRVKTQGPGNCGGPAIHTFVVLWRIAEANEPEKYTFTMGSGANAMVGGTIVTISGVDRRNPFDKEVPLSQLSGGDAGMPGRLGYFPPQFTTTVANAYVVYFVGQMSAGSAWTMSDRLTHENVGEVITSDLYFAAFGEKSADAGPSPLRDFTVAPTNCASNGAMQIVALRPK
jgi:hypothetical protein